MAIVFNKGLRGFILKSGILAAGQHVELDDAEAKKLAGMYPKEIEILRPLPVAPQAPVAEIPAKEEKQEEVKKEEVKAEAEKAKVPSKKGSKK